MAFTHQLLALALSSLVSAVAFVPTAHAAATDAATEAEAEAPMQVGVTVAHAGVTAKASGLASVGAETQFSLADDDHKHELRVTIDKLGDSQLAVKISYKRDGKNIIKKKKLDAKAGIASIRANDGSVVTLKLAPAAPKSHKIEMPDGDDPLAGV